MIIIGDKSNHIPVVHIPQLYYFVASATFFGWPVLLSGPRGIQNLIHDVWKRMLGGKMLVSTFDSSGSLFAKFDHGAGVHR